MNLISPKKRYFGRIALLLFFVLSLGLTQAREDEALLNPNAVDAIEARIDSPTNGQIITGPNYPISGYMTPGSTGELIIDGGTPIVITPSATGAWSYTATGLSSGNHTLELRAVREILPIQIYATQIRSAALDMYHVIDTSTNQIINSIPLSQDETEGLAMTPDGDRIFVVHIGGVDVYETATNALIRTVALPQGTQLARMKPDGSEFWVTQPGSNSVAVVNTTTYAVAQIPLGFAPHDVIFRPDGAFAYIGTTESAAQGGSHLLVVNTATGAVVNNYNVGDGNRRGALSRDGQRVYYTSLNSPRIYVLNTATNGLDRTVILPANSRPEGIEESLDGTRVYVAMRGLNSIYTYDRTTMTHLPAETINSTGVAPLNEPMDLTIHPFNGRLYVGDSNLVSVYESGPAHTYVTGMQGTAPSFRFYELEPVRRFERDTDTVIFGVDPTADLTINKFHSGNFIVGQTGVYSITVSNNGPANAQLPITVTDTLPTGLVPISVNANVAWSCSIAGQSVTCTRTVAGGFIAAGSTTVPIEIVVQVEPETAPSVINTACVESATTDPIPGNNCDDDPTTVVPVADLSVNKFHSGNFIVGQTGTYSITVTNNGPSNAQLPITVTDTLPTGLVPISVNANAAWSCTISSQTVTCTRTAAGGFIADGSTTVPIEIVVQVEPEAAPSVINTACVESATTDPILGNNCDDDPTTVVPTADLSILKTSDTFFTIGSTGLYTVTITNNGPSIATAPLTVTDTLPTGLQYISTTATGWTCSAIGQNVTCTSSQTMPAGASSSISLLVDVVSPSGTSVSNTACVAATTDDPLPGDNCDTVDTPLLQPELEILKLANPPSGTSVAAGNIITYTLRVSNTGTVTLTGVVITDAIPLATAYLPGSASGSATGPDPLVWMLPGSLAPGQSADVTYAVEVLPIGTTVAITNTAYTDSDQTDPIGSNEVIHPFDPTAITLISFTASAQNFGVDVEWITSVEIDTLGFHVLRGETPAYENAQQFTTALIPSKGSSGGVYRLFDPQNTTPSWYYWLREYDTNGNTYVYGPVASGPRHKLFIPSIKAPRTGVTRLQAGPQRASTRPDEMSDVTLESMSATSRPFGVALQWVTSAEINTLGFYVKRSETEAYSDAEYTLFDPVPPQKRYTYWLDESYTMNGQPATKVYGPFQSTTLNMALMPLIHREE